MDLQDVRSRLEEFALGIQDLIVRRNKIEGLFRASSPPVGYAAIVSLDSSGSHKIYIEPVSSGMPTIRLGFTLELSGESGILAVRRLGTSSADQPRWDMARSVLLDRCNTLEDGSGRLIKVGWFANDRMARKWAGEFLATAFQNIG